MKTLVTILVFASLFFYVPVMAGSGHDHGPSPIQKPVNKATAEKNANKVIASLIERNVIDKSWTTVKASSVKKEEYNGRAEWVAIFINDKITKTDKQKLYIFFTIGGKYIAANYTGK